MKKFLAVMIFLPALAGAQSWDGDILSPVNNDLPEWLRFSGDYRLRAEGYTGASYTPGNSQGYLLSRWLLNMNVQHAWFRLFAQMEDARVLGNNAIPAAFPYQDTFELQQAFVELGDMEKQHFAVRAGRQELNFGDQRILGSAPWLNTPRVFDAVRADVNYGRVRVDAFSASVVNVVDGGVQPSQGGGGLAWPIRDHHAYSAGRHD